MQPYRATRAVALHATRQFSMSDYLAHLMRAMRNLAAGRRGWRFRRCGWLGSRRRGGAPGLLPPGSVGRLHWSASARRRSSDRARYRRSASRLAGHWYLVADRPPLSIPQQHAVRVLRAEAERGHLALGDGCRRSQEVVQLRRCHAACVTSTSTFSRCCPLRWWRSACTTCCDRAVLRLAVLGSTGLLRLALVVLISTGTQRQRRISSSRPGKGDRIPCTIDAGAAVNVVSCGGAMVTRCLAVSECRTHP